MDPLQVPLGHEDVPCTADRVDRHARHRAVPGHRLRNDGEGFRTAAVVTPKQGEEEKRIGAAKRVKPIERDLEGRIWTRFRPSVWMDQALPAMRATSVRESGGRHASAFTSVSKASSPLRDFAPGASRSAALNNVVFRVPSVISRGAAQRAGSDARGTSIPARAAPSGRSGGSNGRSSRLPRRKRYARPAKGPQGRTLGGTTTKPPMPLMSMARPWRRRSAHRSPAARYQAWCPPDGVWAITGVSPNSSRARGSSPASSQSTMVSPDSRMTRPTLAVAQSARWMKRSNSARSGRPVQRPHLSRGTFPSSPPQGIGQRPRS